VVELPQAGIPTNLLEGLKEEENLLEVLDIIRTSFLPVTLDSTSHCRRFRVLLWIEEYKLGWVL
jgi:hypothetical protein